MPAEQINISIPQQMARFIRRKVKTGGYTNAAEVVRTAVRRMQEEEAREAKLSGPATDILLHRLSEADRTLIRGRVESGFAAIESGDHQDYFGRPGLEQLAQDVKTRGRKKLASRNHRP